MPELAFTVREVAMERHAVSPMLGIRLHIRNDDPRHPVQNVSLQAQVRIDAGRRSYAPEEEAGLSDLFGARERWARTMGSMLWTHTSAAVRAFESHCEITLPLPCTFDFNVAVTKYLHALTPEGSVPVRLLFSGTVFYYDGGRLQLAHIPWDREAEFRLPVSLWRTMMDHYYPEGAWLCLPRDVFSRLDRYKRARGLPTWERVVDSLLDAAGGRAVS